MKIYVSGPPIAKLEEGTSKTALLYQTLARKFGADHEIELPIRSAELDKLDARDFVATISKKIGEAEGIITVIEKGDQSTPVEATIASLKGKPQYILEFRGAPRLVRGLPGVMGATKVSTVKLASQLENAFKHLLSALEPETRAA
ncbi:hypothetical protein [Bradyrhizobium japonicum]|uniref:hypothetical protein n=1 Tax=Bradyrhizobium japonicum TaxID=375 RepID=UPI0027145AD4|nr:hypothetical protein [Bradyrhizobium japonicum]WLB55850.1 hypothetical protein QIH94_07655 [Bradyrhizobium japonicum]WLB62258.1 hypothetical protein QIH96_38160 [Bradyrhizobium japonicum]